MSTVGVVMLVHTAFDRAEQVIRHWVQGGCPVVVHVDANVPAGTFKEFETALGDLPTVRFPNAIAASGAPGASSPLRSPQQRCC